jgi:pimeloyl-ACP methyl ester carboxylesterase
VEVERAEIRYEVSGDGDRDLLLVHGRGAHHLWWHRVLPLLEPSWRITRVDLSGHGDSAHRAEYFGRVVAGARVEALRGAHHHVILERPERCAELIDQMADAQLRGVAHN